MKKTLKWIVAVVLALISFYVGFTYLEAFSAFFASMLIITGAGFLFYLIDRYLIPEFDTFTEIKNGNIAAGLYVLGYCVLIGACVIGSFVVYR